jgi:predicted nucleic acid-binding protein
MVASYSQLQAYAVSRQALRRNSLSSRKTKTLMNNINSDTQVVEQSLRSLMKAATEWDALETTLHENLLVHALSNKAGCDALEHEQLTYIA